MNTGAYCRWMKWLPLALLLLAGTPLVHADDDRLRKIEREFNGCKYKYEEKSNGYEREYRCDGKPFRGRKSSHKTEEGGCKYEYEEDESGYKEKQECKRQRRVAVVVPGPLEHVPHAGAGYPPPRDVHPVQGRPPYGIGEGRCDRNEIGKVLGGVIGGVIGGIVGAEIGGDGDSRRAGAVIGAMAGILIGSRIGKQMDRSDEGCLTQTLEYGRDGRAVKWRQPQGAAYEVTPLRSYARDGQRCRDFRSVAKYGGESQSAQGSACRLPTGDWQVQPR
jgi:surface antigen